MRRSLADNADALVALSGRAVHRAQLFLYLKASGKDGLNSMNLWSGVDAASVA